MRGGDTTVLRSPKSKEDPYVRLDRLTAQDSNISFAARGLLVYVFSKPQNWKTKLFDLRREGGIGKDALNTILQDLQDHGYIERTETRDGRGRFKYRLTVYESPDLNPAFTDAENPHRHRGGLSATGKSAPAIRDSTRAGAFSSSDQKELNTQETSACAPLPEGSGEDNERYTPARANEIASAYLSELPPESSFVSVGNVLALTKPPAFDVAASRRKSLAARVPSKGRRPKPVVVDLLAVPENFYGTLDGKEKRELADRLDFDRGEFEKRVEAWELSRRESDTGFASPAAMRANLRKYLVNCELNKRRVS